MAWNEPGNNNGNNGRDKDPWGNNDRGSQRPGGREQGPPDLDEVFNKLSQKLGGKFGKKGGGSSSVGGGGAMGFGVPSQSLSTLLEEIQPLPIEQWLQIGMLDQEEWLRPMGGNWRQRAGIISATGMGQGFGGRMICLARNSFLSPPYDLEVEVRLEHESGAAGLIFGADGEDRHLGFYATNGSFRLTCFNGPKVFDWNIMETQSSSHYLPGAWNLLSVRFEQGGQIR